MAKPKFCKDCTYFKDYGGLSRCLHEKAERYDVVTGGNRGNEFCSDMRGPWWGACGQDAKLFEPKS